MKNKIKNDHFGVILENQKLQMHPFADSYYKRDKVIISFWLGS